MEHINIRSSQIGAEKRPNCKFSNEQVLSLLMLFPFEPSPYIARSYFAGGFA